MAEPSGTVTFLFTDIEGSTRLWQQDEAAMRAALSRHDELLRSAVGEHGGTVFSSMGDGIAAAFMAASGAVRAAMAAQRLVEAERWPTTTPLRVRMGLHTGEAELREGDYFGTAVNRAARLMAVGHGGQVLCSQATAGLVETEVELVDLGEHRLRDLDRPMHVFQVGDGAFEPVLSLNSMPGNLPLLGTSFVGREAELAAVVKDLESARLVTLTGVGGVGKTRLALQVAAELAPGFAQGAWICELAAAATGDDMAQVIAAALGVAQRQHMTLAESILDFLRTRQMLVVLDNCEHLLDAAATLAEAVLATAPGVRILATSREGLGIPDERVRPLRSLTVLAELPETSDAVVLFGERARAVHPDFVIDSSSVAAVAEICQRLDGIPLAIELAAARVAGMGPAEIAGHLDERFRLLTGGRRGRVERHQTLRAAIEWSYSLLTDRERAVFDRLGVFPASFDEAAAVAVCAGDGIERWDVIDGLTSLVAKSMVGLERSGEATRYQLLETLRHFARDRSGTAGDLLRRRHAAFYAGFAAEAGAGMTSDHELAWRPRLAAEMDNLRAATGWALDAAALDDVGLGATILAGLAGGALFRPGLGILAWAAAGVGRADELDAVHRPILLALAAYDAYLLGDMQRAAILGGRVIAEADASAPALCAALGAVSLAALAGGDPAGAMAAVADGRGRLEARGTEDWTALYVTGLASAVAWAGGDDATARTETQRGLAGARRIGPPTLLAGALLLHALAVWDDRPDEALAAAAESVRLTEAGAGDTAYSPALALVATLSDRAGDQAGAAGALRTSVVYEAGTGNRNYIAMAVTAAALVLAGRPDTFDAAATLAGAIAGPVLGVFPVFWFTPSQQDRYQQDLAQVAATLGADRYADAQQRGAAMTYDQIIAFTLDQLDRLADL